MPDFRLERARMVEEQLRRRGIRNERVLAAMLQVPRHRFVPPELAAFGYDDGPLPIGNGQTISQPYIVALMTSLLNLYGNETVLEVGTGSGYQAAILGLLADTVHSVERYPQLAERARRVLRRLKMDRVYVHIGDGCQGVPQAAPFDAILVAAAAPEPPRALLEQLADGGRMVVPVGDRHGQQMQVWERIGNRCEMHRHGSVSFVPLRGVDGWTYDEWNESAQNEE